MNVVNRAIAIVVLIVLIIAMPVLVFFSVAMPGKATAALSQAATSLQSSVTPRHVVVVVVIAVLLLLASLLLLWLEIRRTPSRAIQVQQISGGEAKVTIESIVQRLEYNVSRVQDVTSVRPVVTAKGSGVDVMLNLQTAPEIDVPMKTEEVVQVAKDVVEKQMGLKLQKVTVEIKHAPYSENSI
jgi:hypothetical protein